MTNRQFKHPRGSTSALASQYSRSDKQSAAGQPVKKKRKTAAADPVPARKDIRKANLGKILEGYINQANEVYAMRGRAVVFRQHPEVTVIRSGDAIKSAFFRDKAGLDYIGISHGRSFTFDCKETRERASFPMKNIEGHQVLSMQRFTDQGGLAFLLIRFVKHEEIYFLSYAQLAEWFEGYKGSGRKSIPREWLLMNCATVGAGGGLAIDYLPLIQEGTAGK